jgi:D-alanyl-lipoteichoic acid acyltransferase DltB (MBOAT superfamily)
MVFNSYTFIVFFCIMLVLHNLPFSWKVKKTNLLIASYIFYAAWNPPFILLLWLSTVVDYFVGRALYRQQNKYKRRLLLIISLIGNLGMLSFFKYGGFLLENFTHLVNLAGISYHPAKPNIILPAGISFYTFTTLCYTIDMYKRKSEPVKSMLDFALFVTFLPHLVAGPIVRPPQLVPQFETPHKATQKQLLQGLFLLSLGLFMKVVLADSMLAPAANDVFNNPQPLSTLDAWTGLLAFSGQIFYDFAGYSTCAIGVASCLGFTLPENFRFPYAAVGFSDFWRRWHITLSSWLRDYLYIPLGGNRAGRFRTNINLMITMLLGGLWHGANWTFVVWGALHGLYLWIEKIFQNNKRKPAFRPVVLSEDDLTKPEMVVNAMPGAAIMRNKTLSGFVLALITFFFVNVTWVFFRAADFHAAWKMLVCMFTPVQGAAIILTTLSIIKVGIIIALTVLVHWAMRNTRVLTVAEKLPWWLVGMGWTFLILMIMWSQESSSSFIYFQF